MGDNVEYRLGADGRLIFSEFGADRRLNFCEIAAEVVDRGPRLAMLTDSGSGSVKFSLGPDHRRQLGVEVGDRVLVRSWLEVVPAVAAFDPSSYTEPAEPVVPDACRHCSGRAMIAVVREGRVYQGRCAACGTRSLWRSTPAAAIADLTARAEPATPKMATISRDFIKFWAKVVVLRGGPFDDQLGMMSDAAEASFRCTYSEAPDAEYRPSGELADGEHERWDYVEPIAAPAPEPERDGYKYGGML